MGYKGVTNIAIRKFDDHGILRLLDHHEILPIRKLMAMEFLKNSKHSQHSDQKIRWRWNSCEILENERFSNIPTRIHIRRPQIFFF